MKPSDIRYAKDLAVALKLCDADELVVVDLEDGGHCLEFCGFSIAEVQTLSPLVRPAIFESFVAVRHPARSWQPEDVDLCSLGTAGNLTEALRLCAQAQFDSDFDRIAENVLYVEHEPLLNQEPSS